MSSRPAGAAQAPVQGRHTQLLRSAVLRGQPTVVQELLREGADPNGPLLEAVRSRASAGDTRIVELLLLAGAEPLPASVLWPPSAEGGVARIRRGDAGPGLTLEEEDGRLGVGDAPSRQQRAELIVSFPGLRAEAQSRACAVLFAAELSSSSSSWSGDSGSHRFQIGALGPDAIKIISRFVLRTVVWPDGRSDLLSSKQRFSTRKRIRTS
jgi:hypothetical protein